MKGDDGMNVQYRAGGSPGCRKRLGRSAGVRISISEQGLSDEDSNDW